jgi:hypothetical protein
MKASLSQLSANLVLSALLVSLTWGIVDPPSATAKTRPPIEAGDPEIGNEKPRDHTAYSLWSGHRGAPALSNEIRYWERMVLAIRLAIRVRTSPW